MIKPKKHLGQHFLTDRNIAEKIVNSIIFHDDYKTLIEVGAGTGVLTDFLIKNRNIRLYINEIDDTSINYLQENFDIPDKTLLHESFLELDFHKLKADKIGIIGNFPYNISSQIFFKILENRHMVKETVGMVQKEVAERLCAKHGNKEYGILSVLLQAYYHLEYLFTVNPGSFNPPPKVKSAVIRLKRNNTTKLPCDEKLFKQIVKQGFNNRRKTLRNALKNLNLSEGERKHDILNYRAEQLCVDDFVKLTRLVKSIQHT